MDALTCAVDGGRGPRRLSAMRLSLVLSLLVAGCAIATSPDPREGFTARNVGKTLVTHVEKLGTQAVYMAPDGELFLWSSASPAVQRGKWRYDRLATGVATTYQGAAGINYPVQELETEWGVCFQYHDAAGRILRRAEGGDWNCALLADYEGLVAGRAGGDAFDLSDGTPPAPMPAGALLDLDALRAL